MRPTGVQSALGPSTGVLSSVAEYVSGQLRTKPPVPLGRMDKVGGVVGAAVGAVGDSDRTEDGTEETERRKE